jgi:methyl-accepting chemotaxis protein
MIKFLGNVPIFRRLFFAFAIAALIPGVVIILLGNFNITSLNTRGQAVRTSFDAQSVASQEETNLQRMNALLQANFYQIFASHSRIITDPSLFALGAQDQSEIGKLESDFGNALINYQNTYELATSDNMSNVRNILLTDDPANGNSIIMSQKSALSIINHLWANPTVGYKPLQDQLLARLSNLQAELTAVPTVVLTPAQLNQEYDIDYSILHKAIYAFTDLKNNWQQVVDDAVNMGKAVTTVGASQVQPIYVATAIAFILTILIVVAAGYIVNLTITRPLGQLSTLTRRIAKGNTNARANIRGHDEIAMVATAMNNMLDNIVHLIQEAQAQRDALQGQVEKLVSEVSGVGEGDLRIQAEVTADALGVLADSFNYMVEELSSLVVRVKMVAHEVENSTTLTFERMTQLVENADIQIQQISTATVEVERMAESSRQVADRAQSLYAIARDARATAANGRESVLQTVEGMGRIHTYVQDTASKVQALGDSSREIDNIVGAISNIAHQTNRLALDAAIQAAMAGENGKGFGAVAADIRRLAERAKDQASMIGRIVRGVREDIGAAAVSMQDTERETSAGAKLAEEAGVSLESIFSVVERQAREIETINQMATQQLQSSNTVVRIMQTVSNSTQQSSSSTREAAQNMERLARLAEQLLASVEAFKLRDNVDYYTPANVTVTPDLDADNYMTVSGVFRTVTASAQPAEIGRYTNQSQALPPAGSRPGSMPAPMYAPAAYQQGSTGNGFNGNNGFGNGYGNGYGGNSGNSGNGSNAYSQNQGQIRPQQPPQRQQRPSMPPTPPVPPEWQ